MNFRIVGNISTHLTPHMDVTNSAIISPLRQNQWLEWRRKHLYIHWQDLTGRYKKFSNTSTSLSEYFFSPLTILTLASEALWQALHRWPRSFFSQFALCRIRISYGQLPSGQTFLLTIWATSPTLFSTQLATEVHSAHSFLNFPNSLTSTSLISLSLALYLLPFPLFQTSKPSLSDPTRSLAHSLYLLPTFNLLTRWTFLTIL